MLKEIRNCNNCNLCKNQKPLLDNIDKCDVMWVGLSAKKVDDVNKTVPLCNDTNSGKIIEMVESKLENISFYKTNLVKCLPLDTNNKLRYPTKKEMELCINNLVFEIEKLNPRIIFVLGKITYNYIENYYKKNNLDLSRFIYVEHPSYIYVYKRKEIDSYVDKIINICNDKL